MIWNIGCQVRIRPWYSDQSRFKGECRHIISVDPKVLACIYRLVVYELGTSLLDVTSQGNLVEIDMKSRSRDSLVSIWLFGVEDLTAATPNSLSCGRSLPTAEGISNNNNRLRTKLNPKPFFFPLSATNSAEVLFRNYSQLKSG